jgi:hypothetical protein
VVVVGVRHGGCLAFSFKGLRSSAQLTRTVKRQQRHRRRRLEAEAGMKMKVILRGLVHTARKTFERSIPAVRFGHVAYMR